MLSKPLLPSYSNWNNCHCCWHPLLHLLLLRPSPTIPITLYIPPPRFWNPPATNANSSTPTHRLLQGDPRNEFFPEFSDRDPARYRVLGLGPIADDTSSDSDSGNAITTDEDCSRSTEDGAEAQTGGSRLSPELLLLALQTYKDLGGDLQELSSNFVVPQGTAAGWPVTLWGVRLGSRVQHIRRGHTWPSLRPQL